MMNTNRSLLALLIVMCTQGRKTLTASLVHSSLLAVSYQCVYGYCIFYRNKREIVIHSLYYDFFTNKSSPQSSIHFRLMVILTGNHFKLCSTNLSMQVKHPGPTWNIFSVYASSLPIQPAPSAQ